MQIYEDGIVTNYLIIYFCSKWSINEFIEIIKSNIIKLIILEINFIILSHISDDFIKYYSFEIHHIMILYIN